MASVSFAPVRHRSFSLSLSSSLISSTGTWMQTVALGIYLTDNQGRALVGLITMAAWLPAIIGAPVGGVKGDRVQSTTLDPIHEFAMMAATACVLGRGEVHQSSVTCSCVVTWPQSRVSAARRRGPPGNHCCPTSSTRRGLGCGLTRVRAVQSRARDRAPVRRSVVLAVGSIGLCFALNAASFLVVVVMFAFVASPVSRSSARKSAWSPRPSPGPSVAWSVRGCRYPISGRGDGGDHREPFHFSGLGDVDPDPARGQGRHGVARHGPRHRSPSLVP